MTLNKAIGQMIVLRDKYRMGESELAVQTCDGEEFEISRICIDTYKTDNEEYDYPVIITK